MVLFHASVCMLLRTSHLVAVRTLNRVMTGEFTVASLALAAGRAAFGVLERCGGESMSGSSSRSSHSAVAVVKRRFVLASKARESRSAGETRSPDSPR
jgi:hypothetical protein